MIDEQKLNETITEYARITKEQFKQMAKVLSGLPNHFQDFPIIQTASTDCWVVECFQPAHTRPSRRIARRRHSRKVKRG